MLIRKKVARLPKERGMTLIEVLVTLVLISVGLLGVAALQLTTLRSNQEAYVRSQASALAGFILDRIRANQAGFRDGEYDIDKNETGTEATTAGDDLEAWQAEIDRLLPGGEENAGGWIERDAVTGIVTVSIQWTEREDTASLDPDDTLPIFQTRTEI